MRSPDDHDCILDRALEALRRAPVEGGEIYYQDTHESSASVVDQRIESVEAKQERGLGLRVFKEGRVGFSFTPDTSPAGIGKALERAVAILPHVDPSPEARVPPPESTVFSVRNEDPDLPDARLDQKVEMARRIESCALRYSSRIKRVRDSRYSDIWGSCWIANTQGLRTGYGLTRAFGSIELVAVDQEENQTGYAARFGMGIDELEPDAIGIEAASRAINKLGAEVVTTRRTEVVLDPEVVAGVFGTLASAFYADGVLKSKSLFKGLLGQSVARSTVTLIDDGRIPGALNTGPVDGEGTPTGRTTLIEQGILSGYLHDDFTARKMGVQRTGNAQRSGYLSSPHIGTSTLVLRPTSVTRPTLLKMVAKGIYVSEVMGLHTIDPISGDFSLGGVGWEMENGAMVRPVQKMGISGNIRDLLHAVAAVAEDLRFFASGNSGSTLLLEGISISGS